MNTFGLENIPQQRVPALKHCLYPSLEPSPHVPAQEGTRHLLSERGKGKPGQGAPAGSQPVPALVGLSAAPLTSAELQQHRGSQRAEGAAG